LGCREVELKKGLEQWLAREWVDLMDVKLFY
jgi:hypothetical protein